jgi:hypothetical protein
MNGPAATSDYLSALFAHAPSPAPEMQPADPAALARLRRRLAIRNRIEPQNLLEPGLDEGARLGLLDALAADCDLGTGKEQGRWLLRDAPRRAILHELERDAQGAGGRSSTE